MVIIKCHQSHNHYYKNVLKMLHSLFYCYACVKEGILTSIVAVNVAAMETVTAMIW